MVDRAREGAPPKPALRLQDAVETFESALNLGHAEAALYVHLCVAGPAKAGDLASALRLHRNEVYRSAGRLLSRGLIEMTMERPARYAAVSPGQVFDVEIEGRLAAVRELRAARDEVTPLLLQAAQPVEPASRSTYKVIQGRHDVYAARGRLLSEATRDVEWASTFPPAVPLAEITGTLDLLARRVDEGLAFRGLFRATQAGWARLAPLARMDRAQVRRLDVDGTIQMILADRRELLMWVVNDPSESLHARQEVAIHTTAPGFVQAEGVFFDQAWARAPPFEPPR